MFTQCISHITFSKLIRIFHFLRNEVLGKLAKTLKKPQQSNIKRVFNILFTTVEKQVGGRGTRRRHELGD